MFSDLYKEISEIVFRGIFCPHVVDLVEPDQPGLVFTRLELNMFCVSGHDFRVKIAGGGFQRLNRKLQQFWQKKCKLRLGFFFYYFSNNPIPIKPEFTPMLWIRGWILAYK